MFVFLCIVCAGFAVFALIAPFKAPRNRWHNLPQHLRPASKVEGTLLVGTIAGMVATAYLFSLSKRYLDFDPRFVKEAVIVAISGMLGLASLAALRGRS